MLFQQLPYQSRNITDVDLQLIVLNYVDLTIKLFVVLSKMVTVDMRGPRD